MGSDASEFSIERIADLAKLSMDATKAAEIAPQLNEMLQLVGSLRTLELESVTPFFGEIADVASLRDDEVKTGLDRKLALMNAPDTDGEQYRVPKVFE